MKNISLRRKGFTLIEILVSLTILGIIMTGVMMAFANANIIASSAQSNRIVQENMKNVTETIAEDIRKNGIQGVSKTLGDPCDTTIDTASNFKQGTKLCTKSKNEYFLAKQIAGNFLRVDPSACAKVADHCAIVKNGVILTNAQVVAKDMKFFVTQGIVPFVTIQITLAPSDKNGVQNALVKHNTLTVETSISERPF